ncbi:D-hexose-6-phosphate mutarotase [Luteolibacter pohnpeiensis]|uniref:Putative glucose-6-phosphate 1-epimerase n=1 Tax=Luteolibacter pohnpeiensis TaxID=454153 RepID=A0A934VW41_9BACT|nr:D-hexose-6-phosphate mutarotase [Luteolibacter pohnpeiensis]MBK1882890.1 D-hexose-6-phosphate mutarotase [Luteolibacter pohnpeiensis]
MKHLHQREIAPGYVIYEIDHPACKAKVARHGAHLMEWQPTGEDPVIYLSPDAVFHEGKAIRGGIPICWPWFGPHPTDSSKPAHGIARTRFWTFDDATESETGVRLFFSLEDDEATRELWPFPFRYELEIFVGSELEIRLTTCNRSEQPMPVSGAIHAYFATTDSRLAHVTGLYLKSPLHIDREVEAFFPTLEGAVLMEGNREVQVEQTGLSATMIWNPWIEKAASFQDLPDEDYLRFICIEPMIANPDAVIISPGGQYTISSTVKVSHR